MSLYGKTSSSSVLKSQSREVYKANGQILKIVKHGIYVLRPTATNVPSNGYK